jgi:hypothetical protein
MSTERQRSCYLRGMRWVAILVALLALAAPASASQAPTGWGGVAPFDCVLQQAGLGATVPDMKADPFCIEFDKTQQNITKGGIVAFLLQEPARLAAAGLKCRYLQVDHWRAAIVQDDKPTKLYEWTGHYFFDKARGDGGVYIEGFNVNGKTFNPASLPGIPREFSRYMGPGTAGFRTRNALMLDPLCALKYARRR